MSTPSRSTGSRVPAIRPAVPDDLADLVALDAELFGPDAWSAASFVGSLSHTIVGLWQHEGPVRRHNPTIVGPPGPDTGALEGYAVLTVAGEVGDLQRIGVRRGARRGGLATALLDDVLGSAREHGADRVLVEVSEARPGARAFYAAARFSELDRRRRYYRDGTDALVLERRLPR